MNENSSIILSVALHLIKYSSIVKGESQCVKISKKETPCCWGAWWCRSTGDFFL